MVAVKICFIRFLAVPGTHSNLHLLHFDEVIFWQNKHILCDRVKQHKKKTNEMARNGNATRCEFGVVPNSHEWNVFNTLEWTCKNGEIEREIAAHFKRQQIDTSKFLECKLSPFLQILHTQMHTREREKEAWKRERVLNYCQVKWVGRFVANLAQSGTVKLGTGVRERKRWKDCYC